MLIIFGILEPGIMCGRRSNLEEKVIPMTLEGPAGLDLVTAKRMSEDYGDSIRY